MENFELKVGDLVKLRNDLEDGKKYGFEYYFKNMNFKEFEPIKETLHHGEIATINNYHYTKEMIAEVKRPVKYETIYKREEPILDDKEKEYLGNVIRPFRNEVTYIVKKIYTHREKEYIAINLKNDTSYLPNFKKDTMYKNMELQKKYTLEELGL